MVTRRTGEAEMRAWILYIVAIIMAFTSVSVRADKASEDYSAADKKRDLDNSSKCRALADGFHMLGDSLACFNGVINKASIAAPKLAIDQEKIHTLYINSLGGLTSAAMDLGRSIHDKEIILVLHEACFSSCANYIVPAALDLVVQKGTIFGLHGSIFRSGSDYALSEPALHDSPAGSAEWFKVLKDARAEYPEFYKKQAVDEGLYFVEIGVSEQYVTRYFEINRNRKLYNNGTCGKIPPISLMIGPKYLDEFYFGHLLEFDWDKEAIKANPLFDEIFKPTYSIVFDNDLFPTMTPERGEINPLECFSFISK